MSENKNNQVFFGEQLFAHTSWLPLDLQQKNEDSVPVTEKNIDIKKIEIEINQDNQSTLDDQNQLFNLFQNQKEESSNQPQLSHHQAVLLSKNHQFDNEYWQMRFEETSHHLKSKLMFVFDQMIMKDELKSTQDAQHYLNEESASLFNKMLETFKLEKNQIWLSFINSTSEASHINYFYNELIKISPSLIITMGSNATKFMLRKNDKLSQIQGEIFSCSFEDQTKNSFNFSVMPLFHPDFLTINPNMKRSTWISMQKIMALLTTF